MSSHVRRLMQGLRSPRAAIYLYAVLILLPAAVFGGLLWEQLRADQNQTLEMVPREVSDAGGRLGLEARRRIRDLISTESARSFTEYADYHLVSKGEGTTSEVPSPLVYQERAAGIQGWFQFDNAEDLGAQIQLFLGNDPEPPEETRNAYIEWLREQAVDYTFFSYNAKDQTGWDTLLQSDVYWAQNAGLLNPDLGSTAYFTHHTSGMHCKSDQIDAFIGKISGSSHQVLQNTTLHLIPGPTGKPTILALRDVKIKHIPRSYTRSTPSCMEPLFSNQHWTQGFWLDGEWLLQGLPRQVGNTVLADRQLLFSTKPIPDETENWASAPVDLLEDVLFDRNDFKPSLGRLHVAVNIGQLATRYRHQNMWFAGLASIMLVSCLLGLRLLLGRIRIAAEHARRTENFVASITHELRTPISVVKLYGEMLQDDWVKDPSKRRQYAERIVSESDRLSLLVDRVLDKRRLAGTFTKLAAGDLNKELKRQAEIIGLSGAEDVVFNLHSALPAALFTTEGVHTLLSNLVENARKYAPVKAGGEPILVRTRQGPRRQILLEVMDRGPGIPSEERELVLDAFYRIGDEATRSQPGTGLGLNLCAGSMRAMRGSLRIHGREGGGTIFRAAFKRA
ncbi:MAG: HAMP domain-containing histidine kinase [bacterium]|nr:HAMP domain-containing histidine kinase [bacterium]